jgi:hypothetical protein
MDRIVMFSYYQTESWRLKFIDYQQKYAITIPLIPPRALMAGGAEIAPLARKSQEAFMAAVLALHPGGAIVKIPLIEHWAGVQTPSDSTIPLLFVE